MEYNPRRRDLGKSWTQRGLRDRLQWRATGIGPCSCSRIPAECLSVVREIILAPLACEDLGRLIADSLYSEPERVTPLAQLVHEKTAAGRALHLGSGVFAEQASRCAQLPGPRRAVAGIEWA
jgi:hypothetical protein